MLIGLVTGAAGLFGLMAAGAHTPYLVIAAMAGAGAAFLTAALVVALTVWNRETAG